MRAGWNPASSDWEFFSLDTTAAGTTILTRGATPVLNRFGQDCLACHGKAEPAVGHGVRRRSTAATRSR